MGGCNTMALKCLNCHTNCAANDPVCIFCGYNVSDTAASKKKDGWSNKGRGMTLVFVIVGSAIFNSVIGPKYFSNGGERILAAGVVGAICAMLGMFVGQFLSNE